VSARGSATVLALAAALLAGTPAVPRPAAHVTAGPPALPATLPGPPEPPPLRDAVAPAGRPPGPAPGLRPPPRCDPPPADQGPDSDVTARLQLDAVHELATGAGQLIAIIDTGVYPHPRLRDRLRGGGDYLTGGDGRDDCDGHGTAVAGLLAGAPSADDGFSGIAPGAQLLAIRQISQRFTVPVDGSHRPAGDVVTLAEAVVLAVNQGAKVINISEAACLPAADAAEQGVLLQAALRHAAQEDVVVVAAAGNVSPEAGGCAGEGSPDQVSLPGWYGDDVITVAAVGPDDAPAAFTVPGPWVDIAAPGTALRSLAVGGGLTSTAVEGTSFAAPWVAGLAALIRQRFPELTASQVVDRILATARPAAGSDHAVGFGVVDPVAALTAEPAVLRVVPDAAAVTADLPGTAPAPAPPAAGPPLDLLALVTLLTGAGAAAVLLRRRPSGRGR
jgi:membrane-anchored mycosin MYCP